MSKKLTTEDFIRKAREVHGNKYDYSKTIYINTNEQLTIICLIHGEFLQSSHNHLRGFGCPKCSSKFMNTEYFKEKAKEAHNNKYDYSKTVYVDANSKVIIVCPEHGEFLQLPSNHLSGHICAKCSGNVKLNTEDFIKKAREVHEEKYDYSKVKYNDNRNKVIIICPEHDEFLQSARSHLNGSGCPLCANTKNPNIKFSIEEFIQKVKEIHSDKYDYSKTIYTGSKNKIIIICPIHGEFSQISREHLNGNGCPKCAGKGFYIMPVDEAMKVLANLGLKSSEEYTKWWNENEEYCRKIGLPRTGAEYYKTY